MKANETYDEMQARLTKAFDLVKPETHWKDPIETYVSDAALAASGLTLEDIREAVIHFTATVPNIDRLGFSPRGYVVKALGYRAGPAGDH